MRKCAEDFWQTRRIFPKKKIAAAGIKKRFQNIDLEKCVEEIAHVYQRLTLQSTDTDLNCIVHTFITRNSELFHKKLWHDLSYMIELEREYSQTVFVQKVTIK